MLGDTQTQTAILGIGCLVVLFILRRLAPKVPGSLVVLIGSMVIVSAASLADDGVAVVGEPSGGFFDFGLPTGLMASQWIDLVPCGVAIVVLGFTESMGAAKSAAQQTGQRLDPDEELLALGTSNIGAGLSGGFAVTGTLSKTGVALTSGGKTQVGNLVAALVAVLSVIALRPLFEQLASSVLAALIIFAMAGMLNIAYFQQLWRISRMEFTLALLAFLGVLTFGVLPGVVIAVVFALVILVEHIGRAPGLTLGRTPNGEWDDVDTAPGAEPIDGLVVFRQEAPVVFLNARRMTDHIRDLAGSGVEVVILDRTTISTIDSTGYAALQMLRDDLINDGVEMWVVNPSRAKRTEIDNEAAVLGEALPDRYDTLDAPVAAFRQRRQDPNDGHEGDPPI